MAIRLSCPLPRCSTTPGSRFRLSAGCASSSAPVIPGVTRLMPAATSISRCSRRRAVTTTSSRVVVGTGDRLAASRTPRAGTSIRALSLAILRLVRPLRHVAWLVLLAMVAASLVTPWASAAERPRVGLVLSGGGARGAAHVGVLKVLEAERIPIDAIAGTSMGAVVGGLYASGLSANDVATLVESTEWRQAFSEPAPRDRLSFRRKSEDQNFLVNFPVGLKGGTFRLPKGLVSGQ
ncbi:MAG: hypothetical protein EBT81_00920 [Gammaproteobacteria bacterium]|nr:hypothetical protein [Gammaproteobacteria bacterium]